MAQSVPVPDQGWAWMILTAAFTIRVTFSIFGSNVYFVVFQEHFGNSKSEIAWIFAIMASTSKFTGILSAILTRKYGYRLVIMSSGFIAAFGLITSMFAENIYHLYFTCGIIAGFGYGLPNIASIQMTVEYFKEKTGFANSVMMLGLGVGKIISPILCYFLVEKYHWKGSLLIQAGISLHLIICGALARPFQIKVQEQEPFRSQTSHLFKDIRFYISASHFFFSFGFQIYHLFNFKTLISKGIDPQMASFIISIGGITNISSRLVIIAVEWFFTLKAVYVSCICSITIGTLMIGFTLVQTVINFSIIVGLLGVFLGLKNTVIPQTTLEVFGKDEYVVAMGYMQFVLGMSFLVIPPSAGWLADGTGDNDAGMYFGAVLMYIGAIFGFGLIYFAREKDQRNSNEHHEAKNGILLRENNNQDEAAKINELKNTPV